jgi:thioredoxin-dependent peroxiredoxin
MPALTVGSAAPPFDLTDVGGARIRLADHQGRFTLLSFNRFAACPLCSLAIRALAREAPTFSAHLRVVAFFESGDEALRKAQEAWGSMPGYALVGDASARVYTSYGVPLSALGTIAAAPQLIAGARAGHGKGVPADGSKTRMPAAFLISPDLRVVATHSGKNAGDHVTVEQVRHWVTNLVTGNTKRVA